MFKSIIKILIITFLFIPSLVLAENTMDSDGDGISDYKEKQVYFTDPHSKDTDGDGYTDWEELNAGYSPHNPKPVKLENNDQDGDGLVDSMELKFKTNLVKADTDGDGYSDGNEIKNGYDPLNPKPFELEKRIEVDIDKQELSYFLQGVELEEFQISSGKNDSTPRGEFEISNKVIKAWSPYGLWMPYWMGLGDGTIGIHQLPVWPGGAREGEEHLGTPVSHGCIRLGIEGAKEVYNWAEVGTKVYIY